MAKEGLDIPTVSSRGKKIRQFHLTVRLLVRFSLILNVEKFRFFLSQFNIYSTSIFFSFIQYLFSFPSFTIIFPQCMLTSFRAFIRHSLHQHVANLNSENNFLITTTRAWLQKRVRHGCGIPAPPIFKAFACRSS